MLKDMWFLPLEKENDASAFGLKVYVENYNEEDKQVFIAGVFKVLDTLLGEKATVSSLQYLDVATLPSNPETKGLIELVELPKYISWRNKIIPP
jgi:hypothetical protein